MLTGYPFAITIPAFLRAGAQGWTRSACAGRKRPSVDAVARLYGEKGEFAEAVPGLYPTLIAFGLNKKALAEAVAGAMTELKADGTYQKMFVAYGRKLYEEPFDVKGP